MYYRKTKRSLDNATMKFMTTNKRSYESKQETNGLEDFKNLKN